MRLTFTNSMPVPVWLRLFLIFAGALMPLSTLYAQGIYCVRAGATGTGLGLDWNNAYTDLPASLVRGATYYLADGTYGNRAEFNETESGTTVITIKKAVSSDHGTDTGWLTGYGDGQAVYTNQILLRTGYWTFDGQTGGGPTNWESGFGIKMNFGGGNLMGMQPNDVRTINGVTLRHLDFAGPGRFVGNDNYNCLKGTYGSTNLYVGYCYFHDIFDAMVHMYYSVNATFEYSKFARNGPSNDSIHKEAFSVSAEKNFTMRYCILEDISNTGFICAVNGVGGADNWLIYGNVFWYTGAITNVCVSNIIEAKYSDPTYIVANNWRVFNNSIVNLKSINPGFSIGNGTNNLIYNNIWFNNQGNGIGVGCTTHDYNWYYNNYGFDNPTIIIDTNAASTETNSQLGTSNPFVNWQAGDFRLKTSTLPGTNFPAPYDVDAFGQRRGAEGNWDRGAYQFNSTGTNWRVFKVF